MQNVAVVTVNSGFIEAGKRFFLQHEIWVDEGRYLLGEVDRLIHGHLRSLFLVLLEDDSQSFHVLAIVFKINFDF